MPPFIPRKRLDSTPQDSPCVMPLSKKAKLADALDAGSRAAPSLQAVRDFTLGGEDSDSSLSEISSDQLEDVPTQIAKETETKNQENDHEEIDWEDAMKEQAETTENHVPMAGGSLQLTFSKPGDEEEYGLANAAAGMKKGPSKRERELRTVTHKLHVQFLLYHNAIRNRWICDKTVQDILIKQLPASVKNEVAKWRRASGLQVENEAQKGPSQRRRGKKKNNRVVENIRSQRDWGKPSERLEEGKPDLSHGDPLVPLMRVMTAYWKKRFVITAPGLRKRGYGNKVMLKRVIESYRQAQHDSRKHGEKIRDLEEFRELARKCEGSRDVGAQLFTALLRGLGIESRMVASLQPTGFGWTKAEQAVEKKLSSPTAMLSSTDESDEEDVQPPPELLRRSTKAFMGKGRPVEVRTRGDRSKPIRIGAIGDEDHSSDSDDESVIDITPVIPRPKATRFDRDLAFPTYWTEAISPISQTVLPVSPLVLANGVASTPDVLSTFEPRGAKAEKAKQVMAYVIAYSLDGTAKDVTTRYLKRRLWPGKTKGFRIPVQQVKVFNESGKVKYHEDYDWFKTVLSPYTRDGQLRTAVDDVEDSSDLVPEEREKRDDKQEGDNLQNLKASADFVLEKFLRREEALREGAQPVRMFVSGKGNQVEELPVFRRADVERCLSTESWHKEGRRPKAGVAPLKYVPIRAVTLARKREVEEELRQTGRKPMQGLYSWDQTEYIIPPPIKDGIIPKNAYGNIDCFVDTMVPRGAVHIPLRRTVRICKKLEIDYAEAVVGFEFGNKRAVPVINGVVVAKENERSVRKAWNAYNDEQRKKEEGKLEKAVLGLWKKFLFGLRIHERVHGAYGEGLEIVEEETTRTHGGKSPSGSKNGDRSETNPCTVEEDVDAGMGGGFLLPHEEEPPADLVMEDDENEAGKLQKTTDQYPTPISITSTRAARRFRKSLLQESSASSDLSDISDISVSHPEQKSTRPGERDSPEMASTFHAMIPQGKENPTGEAVSDDSAESELAGQAVDKPPFSEDDCPPDQRRRKRTTSPTTNPNKVLESKSTLNTTPPRRLLRRSKAITTSPYFQSHEREDGID